MRWIRKNKMGQDELFQVKFDQVETEVDQGGLYKLKVIKVEYIL